MKLWFAFDTHSAWSYIYMGRRCQNMGNYLKKNCRRSLLDKLLEQYIFLILLKKAVDWPLTEGALSC
jgi:hypothetical protein